MNTLELPSPEVIKKYARPTVVPAPVEKNGTPVEPAGGEARPDKLLSQWVEVTPAMAARWLKNNFTNRPMSDDVVTAYARDMAAGTWVPTHQGIAFNDRDELIDGQHRLAAIVRSGKTIRMMVTFGLPAKVEGHEMTTMDCVDRGRPRSVADQLKIQHGLKSGTQIAQVCSVLAFLCYGEKVRRLSVGQTLEIYRAFQASVDFVIEHRSKEHGLRSAGVLAAFAFVHAAVPGKELEMMFQRLNRGEELEHNPGIQALYEFLTGQQAGLIIASMNKGISELAVHTLWLALQGGKQTRLEESPDAWQKTLDEVRGKLSGRVTKVAALFRLPEKQSEQAAVKNQPEAAAAPAKAQRPGIEQILQAAEAHFKLAIFMFTCRGRGIPQVERAREVIVVCARGYGHTIEAIAEVFKRDPESMKIYDVQPEMMREAQLTALHKIKLKLSK